MPVHDLSGSFRLCSEKRSRDGIFIQQEIKAKPSSSKSPTTESPAADIQTKEDTKNAQLTSKKQDERPKVAALSYLAYHIQKKKKLKSGGK